MNVYLLDINDNLPIFPTNGYSVFISEGALANQDVIVAKALDSDSANNSKLSYEIMDGNQGGMSKTDFVQSLHFSSHLARIQTFLDEK